METRQRSLSPRTGSLFALVEPGIVFLPLFFPGPDTPGTKGSSRGTVSMRKSNWSDLLSALAMSARDNVRRLFESATINARAVISAMKTLLTPTVSIPGWTTEAGEMARGGGDVRAHTFAGLAEEDRRCRIQYDKGYKERGSHMAWTNHLQQSSGKDDGGHVTVGWKQAGTRGTFTSGSLFITFFILAKGSGG